jgi:endonuclease/exonuclease/phosphatase family metal-dependent hydrolase
VPAAFLMQGCVSELSPSLKIANWNVQRVAPTQARAERIREHCAAVDADIWFLTETHQDLAPADRYFSIFSGMSDRVSKSGERWSAIWSKWPIEILKEHVSDPSRCVAGRIAESPFGDIIVYATVLPWNTDPRAKVSSSYQVFADAVAAQKSDWLKIQGDFPQATLILAGDFNQDLASRHYYGSKKKRPLLESALLECNLVALTNGVDDPIARESPPMACIDHICLSSGSDWVLESTARWPESPKPVATLSDHFGVSVNLVQLSE